MPRFKSIIFYKNSSKIKLFLQKNAKFLSAWGSAPRPPKQPLPIANFWLRASLKVCQPNTQNAMYIAFK